jgi:hypothetical protein
MISHAKKESASNAVASGKNLEKIALCMMDKVWTAKPRTENQNAIGARLSDDLRRNMR